jgi:hypothetical protein
MSYDLTFAKPERKIAKKRVTELYAALRRGESNDAFEPLPVDDILSSLCEAYEDFEPAVQFPMIEDGDGAAEVFHSTHWFTFCFRGDTAEMQQRIADILRRFGCPVYDPQVDVLYPLDQPPAKVGLKDLMAQPQPKAEVEDAKAAEFTALLERIERKKRDQEKVPGTVVPRIDRCTQSSLAGLCHPPDDVRLTSAPRAGAALPACSFSLAAGCLSSFSIVWTIS